MVFVLFDPVRSADPPSISGAEGLIAPSASSLALWVAIFCGAASNPATCASSAATALTGGGFEVKKVYVVPSARGRGLSRTLMTAIEDVARELGEASIRLQTGSKQAEAISLYEKTGYHRIGSFGPYAGFDDLVFFEKTL